MARKLRHDERFAPAQATIPVAPFCGIHKASIVIGYETALNKAVWAAKMNVDVKRIVSIITEGPSDVPDKTKDDAIFLKFLGYLEKFAKTCLEYDSHYFYCVTYKDRLMYDISNVGDLDHPDSDKMWKVGFISPALVNKKIRARREPVEDILKDFSGIPRSTSETFEDEDIDELYELLGEDETKNIVQPK